MCTRESIQPLGSESVESHRQGTRIRNGRLNNIEEEQKPSVYVAIAVSSQAVDIALTVFDKNSADWRNDVDRDSTVCPQSIDKGSPDTPIAIGIWMNGLELSVRYGCLSQRCHVNAIGKACKIGESFPHGFRRWRNEICANWRVGSDADPVLPGSGHTWLEGNGYCFKQMSVPSIEGSWRDSCFSVGNDIAHHAYRVDNSLRLAVRDIVGGVFGFEDSSSRSNLTFYARRRNTLGSQKDRPEGLKRYLTFERLDVSLGCGFGGWTCGSDVLF
jgi:hypothetical protein